MTVRASPRHPGGNASRYQQRHRGVTRARCGERRLPCLLGPSTTSGQCLATCWRSASPAISSGVNAHTCASAPRTARPSAGAMNLTRASLRHRWAGAFHGHKQQRPKITRARCAKTARPVCWGFNDWAGQSSPPLGESASPPSAAVAYHTCALREDGSPVCWGSDHYGQAFAASWRSAFAAISSGQTFTHAHCARTARPVCWGGGISGHFSPPQGGAASPPSAAVRQGHTCALRAGGSPVCWGLNNQGQATPP